MSRTYRTHLEYATRAYGRYWTWEEQREFFKALSGKEWGTWYVPSPGWNGHYFLDRKARDRKPWNKPPKWFKQQNRRNERAKEKAALVAGKEIPLFRKGDQYDWT